MKMGWQGQENGQQPFPIALTTTLWVIAASALVICACGGIIAMMRGALEFTSAAARQVSNENALHSMEIMFILHY